VRSDLVEEGFAALRDGSTVGGNAGMTSPAQFFSEENVGHIFASAGEGRLAS
jgi:hypothetical protein